MRGSPAEPLWSRACVVSPGLCSLRMTRGLTLAGQPIRPRPARAHQHPSQIRPSSSSPLPEHVPTCLCLTYTDQPGAPPPEGGGAGTLDVSLTEVCSVCSVWTSAQRSRCCREPPGFNPSLTAYDVTFDQYVASAQVGSWSTQGLGRTG